MGGAGWSWGLEGAWADPGPGPVTTTRAQDLGVSRDEQNHKHGRHHRTSVLCQQKRNRPKRKLPLQCATFVRYMHHVARMLHPCGRLTHVWTAEPVQKTWPGTRHPCALVGRPSQSLIHQWGSRRRPTRRHDGLSNHESLEHARTLCPSPLPRRPGSGNALGGHYRLRNTAMLQGTLTPAPPTPLQALRTYACSGVAGRRGMGTIQYSKVFH